MRVIFSKDRPAQLDLLLRSIERNMEPEDTTIIVHASTPMFVKGYGKIKNPAWVFREGHFDWHLRDSLRVADETVTFFCDDDIVYRPVPRQPSELLLSDEMILAVCLYLGNGNTQMGLPRGFPVWRWQPLPRHDFGFPTAIDGNTYRTQDVLALIGDEVIPNPTMLETVMALRAERIAGERSLMAAFEQQSLVGVPVNRVSDQSGVPFGNIFPQSVEELNDRFLAGQRIDLDALDFSGITSCHHEIRFVWAS